MDVPKQTLSYRRNAATVALTACTPKTGVEQHTRHYVYASDDGFDPTFPPKADCNTNDGAFFSAVLGYGAKDKATGKSRVMCNNAFSSSQPGILNSLRADSICGY